MVLDQGFEFLEFAEYFVFVLHEVNPCLPRKIINKNGKENQDQGDPILLGSEVISSLKLFIKLGMMRHLN